jgi:putative ABC transport system permease protein
MRTPGMTLTAVLALALAIGANTAMFSVVDAVLLRPLPFQEPDRLVMVWEDSSFAGFPRNTPAPANWVDWRSSNHVFTDIAATRGAAFNLGGDGQPERLIGRRVTASFWSVLGTQPLVGRTFTADEDQNGAKLVVISSSLWQRRFGGDRSVIGRKVLLSDEPYEVIGVMPPKFSFPGRQTEVWTPASFARQELARRGSHYLQCFARLKPGVSVEQAQAEMKLIADRLAERYPDSNRRVGAVVVPFREQVAGESKTGLIVLFAASGFVLLIACANVANLLLARASARQREIAVRSALGANRSVILRQLLTESLLLAGIGAALGIGLARLAMVGLEQLVPRSMAAGALHLDWRMLVFTIAVTTATGIAFGVFPALAAGRVDIQNSLRQGGRTSAGGSGGWMREALVVSQTALALSLLTGAGLMLRTLDHLQKTDLGIRTDHLLTLSTDLPRSRYAEHAKQAAFFNYVVEKVRALPGVTGVGYTSDLPLTARGNTSGYRIDGTQLADGRAQDALFRVVTADFLQTMGARLREGRFFTESDGPNSEKVILVNETLANWHFPGQSAVGKRLSMSGDSVRWLTIVGVVKEIRERGILTDTKPAVYMPLAQSNGYWPVPSDLAIRTAGDPEALVNAVRQTIWSVDRTQPISEIRTMTEVIDEELAKEEQQTTLLSAFAILALVLAATGIYGVISYAVSLQRREIGVRMALGASAGSVLGMVLGRGIRLVGIGVAIGIAMSFAGARAIQSMLHGVQAQDPGTLTIAALALALIAMLACVVPARSASLVNPMVVLREE